jgi:SAM-dependent methyltransferase
MKPATSAYDRGYWLDLHARAPGRHETVGYPGLGDAFNRGTYRIRKTSVRRILKRHAVDTASLLEAGVGTGAYAALWKELGVHQWTGADISPVALENLAQRYPQHRFLRVDLTAGRIDPGGGFGLVTALDVLYHLVEEPGFEHAVIMLAGAVRPGGHLLLSDVFCAPSRQIGPYVKRRSLERYVELLADQGLRLVDRQPVFAILGDPVPRPGNLRDAILFQSWRVVSKTIRCCPCGWTREAVGGAAALALWPIDSFLCGMGITRGINLELALFERTGPPGELR